MTSVTNIKFRTEQGGWLVHPELRSRMIADAAERGTNLGDLAVQILCERFGLPHESNGRHSSPREDADQFNFKIPPDLERVLGSAYPKKMADGIRAILCQHYGLAMPARPKFTRRRASSRPATA